MSSKEYAIMLGIAVAVAVAATVLAIAISHGFWDAIEGLAG